MTVLLLGARSGAARSLANDDSATANTTALWSTAMKTIDGAPRDITRAIGRVENDFARCGLSGFLGDAMSAYGGAIEAARDATDVYRAATEWCVNDMNIEWRKTNESEEDRASRAMSMRGTFGSRARRLATTLGWLSREFRPCHKDTSAFDRVEDVAIEILKEMIEESYEVIISGTCYVPDVIGSMKTQAPRAQLALQAELEEANLTFIDAFTRDEFKEPLRLIYEAYDKCRSYGSYWDPPLDPQVFDRIRVHFTAMDSTLANRLLTPRDKYAGARLFAYLINAAGDLLSSRQSCAAGPSIVAGRWFVSNTFDEIFKELALDCGLTEIATQFLERYSSGLGSIVLSAEMDEILETLKRCEEQSNATAPPMIETTINERAVEDLIASLETIDATMTGCRKHSQSAAKRLARALRAILDENQGQKCFVIDTTPLDSRIAQLIEPAFESADRGSIQTRSHPSFIGALFLNALVTSAMISIMAVFAWTISRCKGPRSRTSSPPVRKFTTRTASAYERHFDDIDETLENQTIKTTQQKSLCSPERPRPRPRRTSFSDFTRVTRSKSLDPGAHFA